MEASRKVLVILGHPRTDSFCGALAEAYCEASRALDMQVERLDLAHLDFDPHVRLPSPRDQDLEKDLRRAQGLILWADHIVFIYPTWWGTMPALLKGFLDRALTPGFAFEMAEEDPSTWKRLLKGRSAHLLVTMDTPPWVYRLIYRQPGHRAMGRATLGFCGFDPIFVSSFGPVRPSTLAARSRWLEEVREEARRLVARLHAALVWKQVGAWIRLLRLQFYPMSWVAYTLGAWSAWRPKGSFSTRTYWFGYLCVFLAEVLTVFSNEWFDQGTDRLNRNAGPFNGGSRVLIHGELEARQVSRAMLGVGLLLGLSLTALGAALPRPPGPTLLFMVALILAALSYTVPPLKLIYRGLGELDVGLTHSLAAILCGALIQSGRWGDPYPWLVGIPLFFATLAAITLSAIPDHDADQAVSKRTLAVLLGPRNAARAALGFAVAAAACGVAWQRYGIYRGVSGWAIYLTVPHVYFLGRSIARYLREEPPCTRINGIMVLALTYILWFGLIPLVYLS